ncbi:uncharacterized protein [Aegilops tauschii subsp. strangulata]|uniref:Uncharacterized protein n=2 Tax=Aegilops tauschii TaxID=37682 RepID=A0A453B1R3_AEGTS|nr:uncharacterized protein LOC109740928 [Aegilops tauschii subsp. strangulata]XP_044327939.1 uncharacterized protein LOC123048992 [Triticum aestivum]
MESSWGVGGVVCHLQCEISSVEVTGLGCTGALFLRCHVPAGGGRTIQIDSQSAEAERRAGDRSTSTDVVSWRDVASLACDGSPACVRELADTRSVVFEVRRRQKKIMGRAGSSELLGRAEVAWRDVGVPAVERRVALAVSGRSKGGAARNDPAPVMSVRMSVRVLETTAPVRRNVDSQRETCGCEWSAGGSDDVYGVAACGIADDAGE